MPNYWLHATGTYYFPGMYTAVLPMIRGIWAIVRTVRGSRRARALGARTTEVRPAKEIGALQSAVS
jgi:hypothetical protein